MKLNDIMINRISRAANMLELLGVIFVLFFAFLVQIIFHELPCPLCLYQRLGFFGMALGFLLNLRFGNRPSHYGIIIISALYTSFVALRQIVLHIVPGTGVYGDMIFGFHLYTWSFIVSMIVLVTTAFILSVDQQYQNINDGKKRLVFVVHFFFLATVLLLAVNLVTVYGECGFKECPENPTHYQYLNLGS